MQQGWYLMNLHLPFPKQTSGFMDHCATINEGHLGECSTCSRALCQVLVQYDGLQYIDYSSWIRADIEIWKIEEEQR